MNKSNEPTNGTVAATGLDYAQEVFQRVLDQLRDQQGLIERQQAEIEHLREKIGWLRDERDHMLKHLGIGPETWPDLTPEQLKELEESGVDLQQVVTELNASAEK